MKVIQFDSIEGIAKPGQTATSRPDNQSAVQNLPVGILPQGLVVSWKDPKNRDGACTFVPWTNVKSAIVLLDDGERKKLFPEELAAEAGK